MKLLVVGSGAREHALIAKLKSSPLCSKIYCAPGNGGISADAECVPISSDDTESLLEFAKSQGVGLTVVGPEAPLVGGIVDAFESDGLKIFGPNRRAAAFEGSKALTKEFLYRRGIPTARYLSADSPEEAVRALESFSYPVVVKADGLAGGKGVVICGNEHLARVAIRELMSDRIFGASGDRLVIEEFLDGEETSVMCFADGKSLVPMASVRDYKRVFDNDQGPNTGGMGSFSPNPMVDQKLMEKITRLILNPIIEGFLEEGIDYKGVLYVGLMIVAGSPKVLEFNVRFGDPETQAVLARLKSDLVKIMLGCTDGLLREDEIEWDEKPAVCVVASSGGYPGSFTRGMVIKGLEGVRGARVLHAGTRLEGGEYLTDSGRVLSVCALGADMRDARRAAYDAMGRITFEGMHYRRDIASAEKTEDKALNG